MSQTIPLVSLILPIRNEARYIERCLGTILAQDYPPDRLEILIADGMSTDDTRDIVETFKRLNVQRFNIKLLDNPGKIVPTGLNVALRQANGEIIIRVDGHCEIASDYISQGAQHLTNDGVDAVGGTMETVGETTMGEAIAIATSSWFGVGGSTFRTGSAEQRFTDTVPFAAYTREAIQRVGLFDEDMRCNQDDEYNYRLRKLGGKILLSPDIHSIYYSRGSLRALWRQYFQYGYWKVRVLQKHPRQMRPRQFVPPLFVLALLTSLTLFIFANLISMRLCVIARSAFCDEAISSILLPLSHYLFPLITASYLLANLTASLWTVIRLMIRRPATIRLATIGLLPLVYAILHLSYGLGFLVGLIRFAHRWGDKVGKVPAT